MITDALKNYLGFLGGLLGGLLEFSWAVITYFVVPVLVTEKVGPVTAVKRSAAILRAKWGESLAGEARIGLLGVLFFMLSALVFAGGAALVLSKGATAMAGLGVILMAIGVLAAITSMVVVSTLSTIFQSGVYLYATTGQVPAVARSRAGRERVPAEGEEVTRARSSRRIASMPGRSAVPGIDVSTARPSARARPSSRCSSGAGVADRRGRRAGFSAPAAGLRAPCVCAR